MDSVREGAFAYAGSDEGGGTVVFKVNTDLPALSLAEGDHLLRDPDGWTLIRDMGEGASSILEALLDPTRYGVPDPSPEPTLRPAHFTVESNPAPRRGPGRPRKAPQLHVHTGGA